MHRKGPTVPDKTKYDLSARPDTYWEASDPVSAILQNIKGTRRREMIRDILTGACGVGIDAMVRDGAMPEELGEFAKQALAKVPPELLQESLPSDARKAQALIDLSFMGGEYLPHYLAGEVEIVRVELDTTTADVISLRARRRGKRIRYRWVDEYGSEFRFRPLCSARPLTLGQVIALIDGTEFADNEPGRWTGQTNSWRDSNFHPEYGIQYAKKVSDMVTVSSPFYPRLQEWYVEESVEWLNRVTDLIIRVGSADFTQTPKRGSTTAAVPSRRRASCSARHTRRRSRHSCRRTIPRRAPSR